MTSVYSIHWQIVLLVILILISAFFSGCETGMMIVNRYRIRHLAKQKHRGALRVQKLLNRTDRLLGVILIGSTFANIMASAVATLLAAGLWGHVGVAIASVLLTLIVLIFAEIAPKTLAASYPDRTAFWVSWPLQGLLHLLYPFVWLANCVANGFLRLFNFNIHSRTIDPLTSEELRSVVFEASGRISPSHQSMLLGILDLGKITVNHIMVPRNELIGIDLDEEWGKILDLMTKSQHTRMPVYHSSLDSVHGILHVRSALNLMAQNKLTKSSLTHISRDPYFVPEGTLLSTQLLNFKREKERIGLVVDEYGDIQGLVTLEDILEEIVGEFTTGMTSTDQDIYLQRDGSYLIDGGVSIRELNRSLLWDLPEDGPTTLNGLIIEHLETIPMSGTGLRIAGYPIEILATEGNTVKTARVIPQLRVVPVSMADSEG